MSRPSSIAAAIVDGDLDATLGVDAERRVAPDSTPQKAMWIGSPAGMATTPSGSVGTSPGASVAGASVAGASVAGGCRRGRRAGTRPADRQRPPAARRARHEVPQLHAQCLLLVSSCVAADPAGESPRKRRRKSGGGDRRKGGGQRRRSVRAKQTTIVPLSDRPMYAALRRPWPPTRCRIIASQRLVCNRTCRAPRCAWTPDSNSNRGPPGAARSGFCGGTGPSGAVGAGDRPRGTSGIVQLQVREARLTDIDRVTGLIERADDCARVRPAGAAADLLRQLVYLPNAAVFVAWMAVS
jgi:hypothetical protein